MKQESFFWPPDGPRRTNRKELSFSADSNERIQKQLRIRTIEAKILLEKDLIQSLYYETQI